MMINKLKYVLLSFIASLSAASCNDDVFLDGDEMPPETYVTIDGDGGMMEMDIQSKGLEWIGIDHYSDDFGFSFYDHKGEKVKEECLAKDLSRIHYESRWLMYDMKFEHGHIVFQSIENSSGDTLDFTIRLRYDYTDKIINVAILPGVKSEVVNIVYDQDMVKMDLPQKIYRRLRVKNESSSTQQINVRPMIDVQSYGKVEPSEIWANFKRIKMKLPTHNGGEWVLGDEREINLGATYTYFVPDNEGVIENVEIRPNSMTNIEISLTMSKVRCGGMIDYINPVSERRFKTRFTCDVIEPADYKITCTNE